MISGSFLIARFAGTEIRLHWSMLLIIPYVMTTFRPDSLAGAVRAFLLVGLIFFFVLLHELGHMLVARAFGIRVPSVILWPLGGAAITEREAGRPLADLLIAAAGPLVNFALGGGFFLGYFFMVLTIRQGVSLPLPETATQRAFLFLAVTNVILALTNLIPMYPLDGGRIFRSLVHMAFGTARSNQVTFWLSLALGVGLLALAVVWRNLLLGVTALLLLAGAVSLHQGLTTSLLRWFARLTGDPALYLRIADFDPAMEIINRRIEADPRNPLLYLQRGIISFTLDDLLHALGDAERAINLAPGMVQAVLLKGAVAYALQNTSQAWACVQDLEKMRPGWSVTWLNSAILLRDDGDLAGAAQAIQHAFEAVASERDRSGLLLMYLVRSSILYRQGRRDAARQDWEEAFRLSSREAMSFPVDRQRIFASDWDWVHDYFAFLEEKAPGSLMILAARGETALRAGQWQQAVEDFTRLMLQMPSLQDVTLYRGQAYQQLGNLEQAVADFRRAREISRRAHIRRLAEVHLRALSSS
ncbi:Zn-dependent proteases [Anaerolinea thermolimosa]|uniref:Zn-dependent proteases n=1 Tax=Anaerolinea thermolimosa TaxID=229919 RepID=A0A7U9KMP2_9CHLR|nr:site-2 protease family protein [Anaerolinea thermolimosa]GAP08677.1 Zn-dependent proteases [Anaerolinea thermolimosa]